MCLRLFVANDFESGIQMSRKRNVGLRFFERVSEFATTRPRQTTRNPLFFEQFRVKLEAIPLLAQALNRTDVENCIVVREVCYLARSIHSSRAHRRSLNNGYYGSPKISLK